MSKINIIPAIDLLDGKCVRLEKGDYNKRTLYHENPVDQARYFEDQGIKKLHLVDLNGAKGNTTMHLKVLKDISSTTELEIDFGGGIKSEEQAERVFSAGAKAINIGSLAYKEPLVFQKILERYGADQVWLSADVRDGHIATMGWLNQSDMKLSDFVSQFIDQGLKTIVCTDIARDGMLNGINTQLYQKMIALEPQFNWIASGGVKNIADVAKAEAAGCSGIIIGKALYEGQITFKELLKYVG